MELTSRQESYSAAEPGGRAHGLRQAVLNAPKVSDVYKHYRGENIPDEPFFGNALLDTFGIAKEKQEEFKSVFFESLDDAKLIESHGQTRRVVHVSKGAGVEADTAGTLRRLERTANVEAGDACFVMMPFADPIGSYYKSIYEPAIRKAGLRPIRADDDLFSTGKIVDQIWSGIHSAKVLVAESHWTECQCLLRTRSCSRSSETRRPSLLNGKGRTVRRTAHSCHLLQRLGPILG